VAATVRADDVVVGTELPSRAFQLRRVDLVKYAGASGDFNIIHWNERVAHEVGLPNVIAHGMLTMAEAVRVVTDWCGDPGAVVEYGTKFTKPVPVPDNDAGVILEVGGKVTEILDGGRVKVELTATCDGVKVLGMARVIVQLA
jgi:acyl dehydratase